jgi:hypothetical protein
MDHELETAVHAFGAKQRSRQETISGGIASAPVASAAEIIAGMFR